MADLKELREQQASILTNARAKNDEIKDDTPQERAAEVEAEFDAMMADYDKIGEKIERAKRIESAEAALDTLDERADRNIHASADGVDLGAAPSYREAFYQYVKAGGERGAMNAQSRAVLDAGYEERAQTTTSNTAGGYTVPPEMADVIIQSMLAWGPMYDPGVTTTIPTPGGNPMLLPTVDDTGAGKLPGLHTEGVSLTDSGAKDVEFAQKTLNAYAYDTDWLRVSKELADDSIFSMEALIGGLLGERLGRIANLKLTTGTGSSEPNGIVTASTLGVTAAGTAAITMDEVLELEHSVDPAYRASPSARYMFNDSTLLAIRKLKDGEGNYLWQMGNVQAGIPGTFNGRPYSINQAMDSLATGNKVMLFGDFSKYFVRKVGDPIVGAISDKDFWPGFGMAGYIRFDGELGDDAAVKHLITA